MQNVKLFLYMTMKFKYRISESFFESHLVKMRISNQRQILFHKRLYVYKDYLLSFRQSLIHKLVVFRLYLMQMCNCLQLQEQIKLYKQELSKKDELIAHLSTV